MEQGPLSLHVWPHQAAPDLDSAGELALLLQESHVGADRSPCGAVHRFPESESASAFWANLAGGVDMVTENARRWPVGLHGTPARFGKLLDYISFDATFFAVHGKQASVRAPAMPAARYPIRLQWSWHATPYQHVHA